MNRETKQFRIDVYRGEDKPPSMEWVEVSVDWEAIALLLGPKACKNLGRVSMAMNGMIVVRPVKKEKS
jgi:hypothetical protein